MVGVLVFVDQYVAEASAVVLGDLGVTLQQSDRLADQVVEVEGVRRAQPALVFGVDLRDRLLGRVAFGRRGDGFFGLDQFVLVVRDDDRHPARRELLGVEVEISDDHAEESLGVVGVVDREVGVTPLQ